MLSVKEVLMRGRASKGGICTCVKDGGDLMVVKKGISGLLVYMGLRSFVITVWKATFFLQSLQEPFTMIVLVMSALGIVLALGFC